MTAVTRRSASADFLDGRLRPWPPDDIPMSYGGLLITDLPFTIAFRPAATTLLKSLLQSVSVRVTPPPSGLNRYRQVDPPVGQERNHQGFETLVPIHQDGDAQKNEQDAEPRLERLDMAKHPTPHAGETCT